MSDLQLSEESPEPLGRYYWYLPPRMREAYVDALRRQAAGDYSLGLTEEQQRKLDEHNAKHPRTKPKKRS